jgi:hypothetical protein
MSYSIDHVDGQVHFFKFIVRRLISYNRGATLTKL